MTVSDTELYQWRNIMNSFSTLRGAGGLKHTGFFGSVAGFLCVLTLLMCALLGGCSTDAPVVYPLTAGQSSASMQPGPINAEAGSDKAADVIEPRDAASGCFQLETKYTYIRSYPGGGGVFILRLIPGDGFTGGVRLMLSADPRLNADLDKQTLNSASDIAEITIRPSHASEIKTYEIDVTACPVSHTVSPGDCRTVSLDVELIPWGPTDPRYAITKRDPLLEWVEDAHPEFGTFLDKEWYPYMTYPGILVVEHWTWLDEEWEIRTCFHVMIPPHDWSMIQLRRRGEWDAAFAAMREYSGTTYEIHEIPLSEYPIMLGY
jgi:hypothetical protein